MQTDPIGYADGMNWYAYVGNDPVNKVDPLGLNGCNPSEGFTSCEAASNEELPDTITVTARRSNQFDENSFDCGAGGCRGLFSLGAGSPFGGGGGGGGGAPSRPGGAQSDKPNVLERAGQCALDHYGLNLALGGSGGALAAAGANVIETRGKFAGATPGTSWAGRAASAIYGDAKMAVKLPTLTGFPGIGNGLKLSSTLSAAKFAGRAVPVLGYALLAADALAIGICTVNSGE